MIKKILFILLFSILLTSCISVAVDPNSATAIQPHFVTATLPPTKQSFVPATLTPTPEIIVTPTMAITAPPNCNDGAVLLRDVTIQDNTQVKPGEKFTKTWEFQNTGTCPWINYTLVFASGDQMGAPLSAPIAVTVTNQKAQVSVELTAPSVNGAYTGYFALHNSNDKVIPIGVEQTFWVKVIVGSADPAASIGGSTSTPYVPLGKNSGCAYSQNAGYVSELISLINQARTNAGVPALTVNPQLTVAAQGHSGDMACNNFLDHTGSDGLSIRDRLVQAGYSSAGFGEIIAIGTPQDAMSQWNSDAPHWDMLLGSAYTQIGVGYVYYAKSDFGGYITVDFGSP